MKKRKPLPVREAMCATCPFRETGWKEVRSLLCERALNEASPICHSTGSGALVKTRQKGALICRGARDLQIQVFHAIGFLKEATDEAWNKKAAQLCR